MGSLTARASRPDRRDWISFAARLLLGGVLLVAGGLKVVDPQGSVRAVRGYELLSDPAATALGWALPFVELVVGLLLLTGTLTRVAAAAAAALLVTFIAALASAWARGLSIDCGCFSGGGPVESGRSDYPLAILRDVGLLTVACWLLVHPASRFAVDRPQRGVSAEPHRRRVP